MSLNCLNSCQDEDTDTLSGDDFPEEEELDYFPEMITRPQRLVVETGDNTTLPCEANDSTEFVRIWMKGDVILFTGELPGMVSPQAKNKYSLSSDRISLVTLFSPENSLPFLELTNIRR